MMNKDVDVSINPKINEALDFIRNAARNKMIIVIVGSCNVRYFGRAGSFLEEGERLIILKTDGSLLIHRDSGYKPINWQPPGSSFSFKVENNSLVITSLRTRPVEKLIITISKVKAILSSKLFDVGKFAMHLTEDELQRILYEHPEIIDPEIRSVTREKELKSGKVDIFAVDKKGNPVLIEVKRGKIGEREVLQLYKYISEIKISNPSVRGVIISPDIDPKAQQLINELGLEYKMIDIIKLSKKFIKKGKGLSEYS